MRITLQQQHSAAALIRAAEGCSSPHLQQHGTAAWAGVGIRPTPAAATNQLPSEARARPHTRARARTHISKKIYIYYLVYLFLPEEAKNK